MKSLINSVLRSLSLILLIYAVTGNEHGPGGTVVVSEGSDAILPCSLSTKESVVQKLFDWRKMDQKIKEVFMYDAGVHYNNGHSGQDEQFKGRISHFPDQLQFGNASIIIRNTRMADSGDYTCAFPRLQSEQTVSIKLVVGAAPKPDICIVITEDGVLLKCKVQGFPKPKVEWRDGDGNLLPAEEPQVSYRGDRYYITLLTTVTRTKTDLFHCVATQEELSHRTEGNISVPYYENLFKGTSGEVVIGLAGWFMGLLTFALVLAVLVATKCITIRSNKGYPGNTEISSKPEGGSEDREFSSLKSPSVV
ncbi:CD276 antigen-like isoform X2 [Archocentrus centrarchus]|uniref:CD276 antigen-like isoform X2 n=1 Tax=Archocentrus centrarchus TaxID=63155 RepID=UPI0011E9D564|nr:CD276 antigen-like isoform X2 [Archocentrus centrarchus]